MKDIGTYLLHSKVSPPLASHVMFILNELFESLELLLVATP
jgi:hypothetical protein